MCFRGTAWPSQNRRLQPRRIQSLDDPRIKERLQELRQTDNFTNLFYLAAHLSFPRRGHRRHDLVLSPATEFGWSWWWNVPVTLLAIVLIGAGQHQLTGLAHEAAHHILFRNRFLNDLASDLLCMFPLFSSTQHYRLQHLAHHQFVNDPDRDPDVSQLQTSGHWLHFPVSQQAVSAARWSSSSGCRTCFATCASGPATTPSRTDKNPYLKKGWKPDKTAVRVGILYMLALIGMLAGLVWHGDPLLLAIVPAGDVGWRSWSSWPSCPEPMYHQSRVHPVISMRTMTLLRISLCHGSVLRPGVAEPYVTPYAAACYYLLLWVVPIFTSFSFFMILRQLVQHGNGDRGWLTNTRIFFVNPLINFAVFPLGQDYHLPHHLFASVPHYRLKQLHEALLQCAEYRAQAVEVEGYFLPHERPRPSRRCWTCWARRIIIGRRRCISTTKFWKAKKSRRSDEILRQGEEEKERRRREIREANSNE